MTGDAADSLLNNADAKEDCQFDELASGSGAGPINSNL